MSILREKVERFYREIWDDRDRSVIPELLHPNVVFRGSLGDERHGFDEFMDYVDSVHNSLANYRCVIDDLVVEAPKAFARMTFVGDHVNEFRGFPATGQQVQWRGAALFIFEAEKIREIWVLGDLINLDNQLMRKEP